jgi:CHAT domain-containing protein
LRTNNFRGRRVYRTLVLLAVVGFTVGQLALLPTSAQSGANARGLANQNARQKLEVGKPIERELSGGEAHIYEMALEASQYFGGVVVQRGIDVVVRVIAPDGKLLMELNTRNGLQGDEFVGFITEAAGIYRLMVIAYWKNTPTGKYEIQVLGLRVATETDRALQEAMKLNQEVVRLDNLGKYDLALPLAERAVAIREKVLGAEDPATGNALNNLAGLYKAKGNYAKAEMLYLRALTIREKTSGAESPDTAVSLNNLAALYRTRGEYAKAVPLYLRAQAIQEKIFGIGHPATTPVLNNLALLYTNIGEYEKGELLYRRALNIREKTLGAEHPDTATVLNNLALLYIDIGEYEKAELLYLRVLAIDEKSLGTQHPLIATSLNNLAEVYTKKGEYAKAEPLYLRALQVHEKALGAEHPATAASLNNLAGLYWDTGVYAKAEPLYLRALNIRERTLGAEHPETARSLSNLAHLYLEKDDYVKAAPLYLRALTILENTFGAAHRDTAMALNNLAALYRAKGDYATAIEFRSRCNAVSNRDLRRNLVLGSERQKLSYLEQTAYYADLTISLHAQLAPNDRKAQQAAIEVLWQRKGRGLEAMTDVFATLRRRASPADQILFRQFQDLRAQLSVLTLRGPGSEGLEKHKTNLKTLEEQEEKLQNDISLRSAEFRAQSQFQTQQVTIEDIQKAIPHDTALLEFAQYHPFNPKEKRYNKARYAVYLLFSQGESFFAELGEADKIDQAVEAFRKALRNPQSSDADARGVKEVQVAGESGKTNVKQLARRVDELVMQPVRKLLGTRHTVLLSPDGALNLIPFAALVDENDNYLVENYQFVYLTTGRDLLRLQEKLPSQSKPLLIGNPDYNNNVGQAANPSNTPATISASVVDNRRSGEYAAGFYQPLAGAEREVDELSRFLQGAQILKGAKATEAALKATASPSILHIATHGYFLPDQKQEIQFGIAGPEKSSVTIENPMLRSGLALAGANRRQSGAEDGILTAFEAAGLDLWGTKLVVLSACDTGIGEVKNFNSIYGLRRALVLAGAESQVMSLWPVSDAATRELMVAYYKGLQAGEGRAAALRRVQLQMLKDKSRQHPYYWASFIQSGEWANLQGKR